MLRDLGYRGFVTVLNVIFPPAAVMMLSGGSTDSLMSCFLFILAVIPSHIHGFYISCVYFSRRRKVRKGIYPGGAKYMIYSDEVLNGGFSAREVARLKRKQYGLEKSASRRSERKEMVQRVDSLHSNTGLQRRDSHASRTLPSRTNSQQSRMSQYSTASMVQQQAPLPPRQSRRSQHPPLSLHTNAHHHSYPRPSPARMNSQGSAQPVPPSPNGSTDRRWSRGSWVDPTLSPAPPISRQNSYAVQ